ncbi:MAG TPA: tetratricopeptide repeat protein, partial [Candidatus Obscuribacter sp.]|nr:tetratricopeptide repeat protein [Candidatus Obscuribacter sp.]
AGNMGVAQGMDILLDLAQVKQKTNDADSAGSILQEAMKLATELEEVNPVLFRFLLSKTRQSLADFLKAAGRYEEAEREFQAVFKLQEQIMAESARRYGTTSEEWVGKQIENLENYAQLLTAMKRDADLQKVESEIARLKQEGKKDS